MSRNIEQHIISILKDHDCVVLPNFGGFILQAVSASFHNGTLKAPSKKIGFNPGIKTDDGLLTGALMGSDGLSYRDAQNEINKYANNISYQLKKDRQYEIAGIGQFHITHNDAIKFQATRIESLDKSNYGLPALAVQPITRDILDSKQAKIVKVEEFKAERKTSNRNALRVVLGVVLLLMTGILSLMVTDTHIKGVAVEQANFIDSLFPVSVQKIEIEEIRESRYKHIDRDISASRVIPDNNEAIKGLNVLNIVINDKPKGYYQIIGSYSSMENAQRMEQELFKKGMDSYILPASNGFFRVGIYLAPSLYQAHDLFQANEKNYANSWLIQNK